MIPISYDFNNLGMAVSAAISVGQRRRGGSCSQQSFTVMSSHRAALLVIMLSYVLSRSFCQTVAEANRSSYRTFGSVFRAFTTSSPTRGNASANGK